MPAGADAVRAAPCACLAPEDGARLLESGAALAVLRFGDRHVRDARDPRRLTVGLPPLQHVDLVEVWPARGAVSTGWTGDIGHAADGSTLLGHLLMSEDGFSDLAAATAWVYRRILDFLRETDYPRLLRVWNYLDDIHGAQAGLERYRHFCVGRDEAFARHGMGEADLPAASAVGARTPGLLVTFLAAPVAGMQVENPRQRSAFHYPRRYGPRPPRFSRATLRGEGRGRTLLLSGTASIVGHRSLHPGDVDAQVEETLRNLERLGAQIDGPWVPRALRAYVREPEAAPRLQRRIERWAKLTPLVLRADVCRRELLVEVEGVLTG